MARRRIPRKGAGASRLPRKGAGTPSAPGGGAARRTVVARATSGAGPSGASGARSVRAAITLSERPSGMTLTVKFMLILVLTLFALMFIFTWILSGRTLNALEEQIDRRGIELVTFLAELDQRVIEQAERARRLLPEGGEGEGPPPSPESFRYLEGFLSGSMKEHVLNVSLTAPRGDDLSEDPGGYSWKKSGLSWTRDGVTIEEGLYRAGSRGMLGRRYSRSRPSVTGGGAWVLLRADRLEEARGQLLTAAITAFAVAAVIGGMVAFWLASLVTQPIRQLVHDMHVVARTGLNHQTAVRTRDEVGLLASTFNEMTRALKEAQASEVERQSMERDLNLARGIQSNLLPRNIPRIPGVEIAPFYRSAREVGGDYYDLLAVDRTHLGMVVADVSGKGVQGSLVMTMTRSVLRSFAPGNASPAEVLKQVNRLVTRDLKRGTFVTMFYGVLDLSARVLRVASAGHNPVLVVRDGKVHPVKPGGIAIGMDPGPLFESTIKEEAFQLRPEDLVLAYTDGVVEAMDAKREEFGMERLARFSAERARQPADRFVQELVGTIESHQGRAPQHDDITIVAVRLDAGDGGNARG